MAMVFSQAAPFTGPVYQHLRADDGLPTYREIADERGLALRGEAVPALLAPRSGAEGTAAPAVPHGRPEDGRGKRRHRNRKLRAGSDQRGGRLRPASVRLSRLRKDRDSDVASCHTWSKASTTR